MRSQGFCIFVALNNQTMKTAFFFLFGILLSQGVFSQGPAKRFLDSITGIETVIIPFVSPSAEPNLIKYEYVPDKKRQIVFLNCADSSNLDRAQTDFPKECKDKYSRSRSAGVTAEKAYKSMCDCSDNYYKTGKDGYKSDTLYIESNSYFLTEKQTSMWINEKDLYFARSIHLYDKEESYHYGTYYYDIEQLKGRCLTGNDFRVEHRESWENGQKEGKWVYYDPSGNEISNVTYKAGKPVK